MIIRGGTVSTPTGGPAVVDDTKVSRSPWSSKNTVDKLCPSFDESGSAVRCEPVEGYPLQVVSTLPESDTGYTEITLHQLGKNLVDLSGYVGTRKFYNSHKDGDWMGTSLNHLGVNAYIPITHLQGLTITVNYACGVTNPTGSAGIAFLDANKKYISGSSASTFVVPTNAYYMRATFNYNCPGLDAVQFELGDTITAFESYRGMETHTVALDQPIYGGSFNFEVAAVAGVNTLISGAGTIEVSGKSDPVRVIEKLTNAIIALGGNI